MLGSSVHYAQFVPASLFQVSYRKEKQFGEYYATIERRPAEGEPRRLKVCWCRVAPGLLSEVPDQLFDCIPRRGGLGAVFVLFIEQKSGDWLVAFKAENILASLYVKMTGTEMASLLERAAQ